MVIDEYDVENALLSCIILHHGEDLHKEDGGRLWKKMVIDEHHVENALLILHEGEDLHMDDGDGGGDANGHNVLLFLRKWTRFKWIEGKTKDKIDFRWLDEKHFNCSFTNRNGDVEIGGIVWSAHYSICYETSCLALVKMVTMHFSQA